MSKSKEYEVGYGRPPQHSRFKPGQSGNPKGRPRQRRNLRSVLDQHLQQTIEVTVNGRPCRMKRIDALVRTTVDRALKNDPKAISALIIMMRQTGAMNELPEPVSETDQSVQDEAILALFRQRHGLPQKAAAKRGEARRPAKRTRGGLKK